MVLARRVKYSEDKATAGNSVLLDLPCYVGVDMHSAFVLPADWILKYSGCMLCACSTLELSKFHDLNSWLKNHGWKCNFKILFGLCCGNLSWYKLAAMKLSMPIDDFGTHEVLVDNPSCTNNQTESKGFLLKVELIIFAGTLSQGCTNMLLLFSHHHQVYQHEILIKGCDPDLVWNDTFINMLSLGSLGLWCYGSEVQSVGISYAKIANLPPTIGLNSSLVYPLIGNSIHLGIGLISIASLVMESMLSESIPYSQDLVLYLKLAFTATFFVGLFQSSQGNKICKITVIDEMPNGPNPLSSNMLYFNVHHLALAIKTGLVTRIWSLTEGIAIGRIVVADINNRVAVHAIRHLFPDGNGFFPSYFYDTFDEGQSVTDPMRSIYIFDSEKPFTIQQGIELFQHQLPKGSPLVLQHHEIVDVLHRKMIHKGNVQAAKVLIKWKNLPPKHGT